MTIAGSAYKLRRFEYDRKRRRTPCREITWTFAHRTLAAHIASECGEGSASKRLPNWIFKLPRDKARFLLDAMMAGDGTSRKHSRTYYTTSKTLADDVQSLCVVAGLASQIWGPYEQRRNAGRPMYQVYVAPNPITCIVTRGRSSSIYVEQVRGRRVVCFTVPNEILVTRRNGKVAIQGNTKHAMHLVRLTRMCREILETGTVIVKRTDRDELLSIRHGAWSYDQLIEWFDREDAALNEVYAKSTLRHHVDRAALDKLCISIVEEALS
jgi:hypothetical protein